MEQLKSMKESLTACVQGQMGNLNSNEVKAEELGAAIDMIKDLSEAIYYCTITKAMEDRDKTDETQDKIDTALAMERLRREGGEGQNYYGGRNGRHYMMPYDGRMYYDGAMVRYPDRRFDEYGRMYYDGSYSGADAPGNQTGGNTSSMTNGYSMRDSREGRAYRGRRGYMEAKENHMDDTVKRERLSEYIKELGDDITEMIGDATPEEKDMMRDKLMGLVQKIA